MDKKILKVGGGLYTVRLADRDSSVKVKEHRRFTTKEEAEASLPKRERKSRSY